MSDYYLAKELERYGKNLKENKKAIQYYNQLKNTDTENAKFIEEQLSLLYANEKMIIETINSKQFSKK